MGVGEVEGEGEGLAGAGGVVGGDAGDEGAGVAGEVEVGFGAHRLDEFDGCVDDVLGLGAGRRVDEDVFGADAEDDGFADVRAQGLGAGRRRVGG